MNETIESSFPQTRQELSNLKSTAVDAAKDIGSTASVHAKKVQGSLESLASNAQRETGDQLNQVKGSLGDLANEARDYITDRPWTVIGIALAVGFIVGRFRSGRAV